jgi:hypothetical protein
MMVGREILKLKMQKEIIFYYLTDGLSNLKENNEIEFLKNYGRVTIIAMDEVLCCYDINKIKKIKLKGRGALVKKLINYWLKICFLLSRPAASLTDKNFPRRNVYSGNVLIRNLINIVWPLKFKFPLLNISKNYEYIFFIPFVIIQLFNKKKRSNLGRYKRIIVHDALIIRLAIFAEFIVTARKQGFLSLANIKSWDNPQYSQFIVNPSGYLTWSEKMWEDVQLMHCIKKDISNFSWGPRTFFEFNNIIETNGNRKIRKYIGGTLFVGYAAAFGDEIMLKHEINMIDNLAKELVKWNSNIKILFRPYPVVVPNAYGILKNNKIIEIEEIEDKKIINKKNNSRIGSDEERYMYLKKCHFFISMGTSFTFEAAIFGLPIAHYYLNKENRVTECEHEIFNRIDISDHILKYFNLYLEIANDVEKLSKLIENGVLKPKINKSNKLLLEAIGVPLLAANNKYKFNDLLKKM